MPKNVGVVLTLKDRFSSKLKDVSEKLGTTEKKLQRATMTVRKFSNQVGKGFQKAVTATTVGIGAIVGGSFALANKTAEVGDRIDKMSQKIGMSRKAFQEWDYIMSQNGGSVDSLQMGFKGLANQMEMARKGSKDSTGYFKKLGVAIKDNNGNLRTQDDVFNECIHKLQSMKNPTEKAILANKLFGKSAIELKPLLNQSAESVDTLRQRANDLGMVISDDVVDASVKFTDTQDTLKRSFGAMGTMIGAELIPVMQQASDFIIENMPTIRAVAQDTIGKVTNIIKFLADNMSILIPIASACVSSIVAFNIISTVIKTFNTLRSVIQGVSLAQGIWNALQLANPIGLIAIQVGALIGVIVLLIANWDKITKAVGRAVAKMKEFVGIKPKKVKKDNPDDDVSVVDERKNPKPSRHALGTPYFQGGSTRINEGGRSEIVNLPSGSQIIPHDIAKNNNKTVELKVEFNIAGNLIGNRELFEEFADMLLGKVENKLQTV